MTDKLFELKPCPQCKGTGDAHHQGHYYDCGDCLGTGYEEPQGRIVNLELMLNEHKMALKSSDAHNNDLAQKFEMAQEQIDHILLRLGRTQEKMFDAEMQRDRLAEALRQIKSELGVPQPEYPAPVANAVKIANKALVDMERVMSKNDDTLKIRNTIPEFPYTDPSQA